MSLHLLLGENPSASPSTTDRKSGRTQEQTASSYSQEMIVASAPSTPAESVDSEMDQSHGHESVGEGSGPIGRMHGNDDVGIAGQEHDQTVAVDGVDEQDNGMDDATQLHDLFMNAASAPGGSESSDQDEAENDEHEKLDDETAPASPSLVPLDDSVHAA